MRDANVPPENRPASPEFFAFVSANVVGMLLVAMADGKLHWNEHEAIVEAMRVLGDHVSAQQTLTFLDETAHLLEAISADEWPTFFHPVRRLPPHRKELLLGMATRIAFSDSHLSVEESRLIHKIADWIEANGKSRRIWKRDVHTALAIGRQRGFTYTGVENLELV